MAHWCHPKHSLSSAWRIPYPRSDWHEEYHWNSFLINAMTYALAADAVFATPGEDWGEAETDFFRNYLNNLDEVDYYEREAITG